MNALLSSSPRPDATAPGAASPASPAAVSLPFVLHARAVDRRVRAWRFARIAAGAALVTGGLSLPLGALGGFTTYGAPSLLAASWGLSVAAFVVTFIVSWLAPVSGRLGDRGALASCAWPLAGLALVLPLSLHALFLAMTESDVTRRVNEWAGLSWAIVGHCHLALAGMAVRRVERLVHGERALSPIAIYGITVGLAMVPGAIFLLIPPILVAFTGLPFLFFLWLPEPWLRRERAALAGVQS